MTPFIQIIDRTKELQRRCANLQFEIETFFRKNESDLGGEAGGITWAAWDLTDQFNNLGFRDEGLFELEIRQQHSSEAIIEQFQESQLRLPHATVDTREWMAVRVPLSLDNMLDKGEQFLEDAERLFKEAQRVHREPPPTYQEPVVPSGPPPGYLEIKAILADGSTSTVMELPVGESLTSTLLMPARRLQITTADGAEFEVFNRLLAQEVAERTICIRPSGRGWLAKSNASGAVFIRFDNKTTTALHLTFDGKNVSIDKL